MTAPTPSPEEWSLAFVAQIARQFTDGEGYCPPHDVATLRAMVDARDAALLAPLRAENALLRAEATAHMGVARAAEADVTRLREALRPFAEIAKGFNGDPSHDRDVFLSAVRPNAADWFAAARVLAEGQT